MKKHKQDKHFRISQKMSPKEFGQTDYGRVFYNTPSETRQPKTEKELASMLKSYHRKRIPVTIRNTAHSINGQTLTDGVQIDISEIKGIKFDKKKMIVTAGTGNSWHEILQALKFPKYCLPLFPNNPNQEIKIGGTTSAGGCGPYSSNVGGFWNYVESIRLVTMTGRILTCSRTKNPEYFRYALGGFGRTGVISQVTVKVVPSKDRLMLVHLVYHNPKQYFKDLKTIIRENKYSGVLCATQLHYPKIIKLLKPKINIIGVLVEVDKRTKLEPIVEDIKSSTSADIILFLKGNEKDDVHHVDLTPKITTVRKRNIVYFHPKYDHRGVNQLETCQVWGDYNLPLDQYPKFMKQALPLINKYKLNNYSLREPVLHNHFDADMVLTYCLTKQTKKEADYFPLSLDFPGKVPFSVNVGIMFTVPPKLVEQASTLTDKLTDICYELGGKRYMYGTRNLTKAQVIKQYGAKYIKRWNKIKKELDPQGLLNPNSIPYLDDM